MFCVVWGWMCLFFGSGGEKGIACIGEVLTRCQVGMGR